VLAHEGGYTPGLPDDPGGETNFGISKRSYPQLDIKNLSREDAIEIYRRDFWHYDAIEDQALANCVFDCAVNQGPKTASRLLTKSGGNLKEFQTQRLIAYAMLAISQPTKARFLHSWFYRTLDV
jgi:lysozyme family protein